MSNIISNKSKTYLLPLLSEFVPLRKEYITQVSTTYIYDDMDKYTECLFIRQDFNFKSPEYTAYEHQLTECEYFVDLLDIGNEVIYIFKFPEVYLHEYDCYIKGKYSCFGVDAKELILKFWTNIYNKDSAAVPFLIKVKQILFKDKILKQQIEKELSSKKHTVVLEDDAELSSVPDTIDEIFELSQYQKK